MRQYELVCIFHPELDEAAFTDAVEKVKEWIVAAGGSVDKVDIWGRRKMAYPIRKQMEGQYVLLNVSMEPAATAALEHNLKFHEPLMRHLLVLAK